MCVYDDIVQVRRVICVQVFKQHMKMYSGARDNGKDDAESKEHAKVYVQGTSHY